MSDETLNKLQETITEQLLDICKNGIETEEGGRTTAPAAYFAVARQLLKDNGVNVNPDKSPVTQELARVTLPFNTASDEYGLN